MYQRRSGRLFVLFAWIRFHRLKYPMPELGIQISLVVESVLAGAPPVFANVSCARRPEVILPDPNRGHYVAQLRNRFNIREITPESRTRVKFCVSVWYKIPIFSRFFSRIFKVLGEYESFGIIFSVRKILLSWVCPNYFLCKGVLVTLNRQMIIRFEVLRVFVQRSLQAYKTILQCHLENLHAKSYFVEVATPFCL